MNKFWQWMGENKYAYHHMFVTQDDDAILPTKEMLIGYMIKYIVNKKGQLVSYLIDDVEIFYAWLESKINEIGNK